MCIGEGTNTLCSPTDAPKTGLSPTEPGTTLLDHGPLNNIMEQIYNTGNKMLIIISSWSAVYIDVYDIK